MFTGLIAAACKNLETLLHDNGHVRKSVTNGMSNGHLMVKTHINGGTVKSSNGPVHGVYCNGNGHAHSNGNGHGHSNGHGNVNGVHLE